MILIGVLLVALILGALGTLLIITLVGAEKKLREAHKIKTTTNNKEGE